MTEPRQTEGESKLSTLLKTMSPSLQERPSGFFSMRAQAAAPLMPDACGVFREAEGITIICSFHGP